MSDEIGVPPPPPTYPAGWYPSHTAPGRQEYWDGARWTGAYSPVIATPATARKTGISTWIGIALVGLWLLISLLSAGASGLLINAGVVALITALYVVITGRPSWMRLKGRKIGALVIGAALIATFTGAGIAPRTSETAVVSLVDSDSKPQGSPQTSSSPSASASATPSPSASAKPAPKPTPTAKKPTVVTKKVSETQIVDFTETTVDDANLAAGTTQVVTPGKAGKRTVVYTVTYTDGVETGRVVTSDTVTTPPITQVVANGTYVAPPPPAPFVAEPPAAGGGCDPNYDPCVPIDSDVDCPGGSGNGPSYASGQVYVIGTDIYDLDRDNNGIGCD